MEYRFAAESLIYGNGWIACRITFANLDIAKNLIKKINLLNWSVKFAILVFAMVTFIYPYRLDYMFVGQKTALQKM